MNKKKVLSRQEMHRVTSQWLRLHELKFELLPHPLYFPDLACSDYYLFANLKKMPAGKKFGSSEGVIAKTEAYFKDKDKSVSKKGIEMLEKRWTDCIAFEEDYINE